MLPVNGLYGHIRANTLKSAVLLAGFAVLIAAYWWAGCLAWSAVVFLLGAKPSPKSAAAAFDVILAAANERAWTNLHVPVGVTAVWYVAASIFYGAMIRSATGARAIARSEAPRLYEIVERMAIAAGLPMPRVEIIESSALNAYAAGLGADDATVAVTRGLLKTLEPRELEAVIAHEMIHIRNRDVRLMVVALVFAGGITLLGDLVGRIFTSRRDGSWTAGDFDTGSWRPGSHHKSGSLGGPALIAVAGALLVAAATMALSHLGALMTRLAISRSREFLADAGAVELTRDADALISALVKISGNDYVPGAAESMSALMISSKHDEEDPVEALFSTHPPISARIAALQTYAGGLMPSSRPRRITRPVRASFGARAPSR